jgi:hypothetical protein
VAVDLLFGVLNWAARALAIPGVKSTWSYGKRRLLRRQFKRVFGSAAREYSLAYADLEVNPTIQQVARTVNSQLGDFPLIKPARANMMFKAQKVVSCSALRALSYIGSSLRSDGALVGRLVADDAICGELDVDFISFGAMSNLKTIDVFANPSNQLAEYNPRINFFVSKTDGTPLCDVQAGFDYGIILKIHPSQFPQRTWIACAGVGEWGTSGSAWFLANKWKEIAAKVKESDQFVCVIKLVEGQDQSARLFDFRK